MAEELSGCADILAKILVGVSLQNNPGAKTYGWCSRPNLDTVVQVAMGSSTTYKATDMCASPANDTGFFDPGKAMSTHVLVCHTSDGPAIIQSPSSTLEPFCYRTQSKSNLTNSYKPSSTFRLCMQVP